MAKTKQMLNKVLEKIATEHDFVNCDLKIEPISSAGANYTSTLYNVTIKEGGNTHHLFAKTAAMEEQKREQAPRVNYTEIFVYTELVKVYERIQDHHQVPMEHRLTLSKCYGCNPTIYEETVVLEDLVAKGYQAYDRVKSINWEYAVSAVTEMAKMHALSFAYREYYPKDFHKVINYLKFERNLENESLVEYINTVTTRAIATVHENMREKLKKFFEMFGPEKYMTLFSAIRNPVLVHGDFRPSNLMHRIRDDGTIDIKVIDLQTMVGSSPIVDLLYLIFTGFDEQFRAQYFRGLLHHYYAELQAAIMRLHLVPEKVCSRADFEDELKAKLPFGITVAVFTLPIVTMASEDAAKANEDLDIATFSTKNTNDLYSERLNGIVNDYLKWGIFK